MYQLISYSYSMISLNLEKNKAINVINYFKNYYELNEDTCKILNDNFLEYSKMYDSNNLNYINIDYDNKDISQ
jgi:hypothetical protein